MVCLLLIHSSLTRHEIPKCGASPLMASGKLPKGSREPEVLDNSVSHMELPPCKPLLVPPFSFLFVFLLRPPSRGQGLVGREGFLSAFFCFGPRTHIQIQKLNDMTQLLVSFHFLSSLFHFIFLNSDLFYFFATGFPHVALAVRRLTL